MNNPSIKKILGVVTPYSKVHGTETVFTMAAVVYAIKNGLSAGAVLECGT